jgi:NADPH-dependent curcumin reductase CurA
MGDRASPNFMEKTPQGFIGLLKGNNFGKLLVKVSE